MDGRITVTGADERTSMQSLVALARMSPLVEIGLLYTFDPEGRPRYPQWDWLQEAVDVLGHRCAVHVCGGRARSQALCGPEWLHYAGRVQVNGSISWVALTGLTDALPCVITQHNPSRFADLSAEPFDNHQLLIDASGGRGLSPAAWSAPATSKPVGFAGGLGPRNLAAELNRLRPLLRPGWWVDMENSLRVDDWFSVDLAGQAIETHLSVLEEWAVKAPATPEEEAFVAEVAARIGGAA